MIDALLVSLIDAVRFLHPWPWHPLELWILALMFIGGSWVVINWTVGRIFRLGRRVIRRYRTRRVLRERSNWYADPALVSRPYAVGRGSSVARGRLHEAVGGVQAGRDDSPESPADAGASQLTRGPAGAASSLVDPRVAGYGLGTVLEASPEDRVMFMERLR